MVRFGHIFRCAAPPVCRLPILLQILWCAAPDYGRLFPDIENNQQHAQAKVQSTRVFVEANDK